MLKKILSLNTAKVIFLAYKSVYFNYKFTVRYIKFVFIIYSSLTVLLLNKKQVSINSTPSLLRLFEIVGTYHTYRL